MSIQTEKFGLRGRDLAHTAPFVKFSWPCTSRAHCPSHAVGNIIKLWVDPRNYCAAKLSRMRKSQTLQSGCWWRALNVSPRRLGRCKLQTMQLGPNVVYYDVIVYYDKLDILWRWQGKNYVCCKNNFECYVDKDKEPCTTVYIVKQLPLYQWRSVWVFKVFSEYPGILSKN